MTNSNSKCRKQFYIFEDRVFGSLPDSPWNDLIQDVFDRLNYEYDQGIRDPKNWAKDFCVEYQKLGLNYKDLVVYVDLHQPSFWMRIKNFLSLHLIGWRKCWVFFGLE